MAKSEDEEKPDSQTATVPRQAHFIREVWGILYLAVGTLVLISLVSHLAQGANNVLGPFVGSYLAAGLIKLFGSIVAFFMPLAILLIGWSVLCGMPIANRIFTLWAIATVECATLLAIHRIPLIVDRQFDWHNNMVGSAMAALFSLMFGKHCFGPYFIVALVMLLTVMIAFRVHFSWLIKKIWRAIIALFKWISESLAALFKPKWDSSIESNDSAANVDPAPEAAVAAIQEVVDPKLPKRSRKAAAAIDVVAVAAAATVESSPAVDQPLAAIGDGDATGIDTFEVEKQQNLRNQLLEFRSKKHEPIKITAIETPDLLDDGTDLAAAPPIEVVSGSLTTDVESDAETKAPGKSRKSTIGTDDALFEGQSVDGGAVVGPVVEPVVPFKPYELPSPDLLKDQPEYLAQINKDAIEANSHILEKTLMNFGIEGKVVNVSPGPVITRYEIELAPGTKISKIVNLQDDISLAVGGQKIRIQAPIPGKAAIGIELPNTEKQTVHFKHILLSDLLAKTNANLPVVVGRNISGKPFVTDIAKMPHLLIAGQTGAGKSVCINSFLCSLLMTKTPDQLRLIMIDPKKVEMAIYDKIPHLIAPVVTEPKEAVKALLFGVSEMERRYKMLAKVGARNLESFNARFAENKIPQEILAEIDNKPLPFVVIMIDELADLMMTASKDVEILVQRIAQLARAVGIHLIVATQRPSVDIITGPIKANLTSRIAFRTIQSTDSRTILGSNGSEKLLGNGDMLFLRNGAPDLERFHGAFISEEDVEAITTFVKNQNVAVKKLESFNDIPQGDEKDGGRDDGEGSDRDALFGEAAKLIVSTGQASTSFLQRRMKIGFARAGRIMDELERAGIVGPPDGAKPREILVHGDELEPLLQP